MDSGIGCLIAGEKRMNSAVYVGSVKHTRLRPVHHAFQYRVFYLAVDVDELDQLDSTLRWFSHNRFNLFSLHDADHGADDGTSLRHWVDGVLEDAGIDSEGGPVRLLAYPRVLGYVFNPLSVWYCSRPSGELAAVIYEVRNTFGDKHSYVVPIDGSASLRHQFSKLMHVSPFMDMDQSYEFAIADLTEHLSLGITQGDDDGVIFRAGLTGRRRALSDRTLISLFFSHPLVTLKSIGAIHWQALFLWGKRVGFRRRPAPPATPVSVVAHQDVQV